MPASIQVAEFPYPVAAAGREVRLVLAAREDGEYTNASALFNWSALAGGETITINDITFRYVVGVPERELAYLEFGNETSSTASWTRAFNDSPLAADYRISVPFSGAVEVTARRPGPAWNLTVAASNLLAINDGDPQYRSENTLFKNWGCYVELYAYLDPADRSYPAASSDETRATLLTRLELPFNTENRYAFDLAPWLAAAFTSQARAQLAYFVRYGEVFATATQPYRRRYPVDRWPAGELAWVVDAADGNQLYPGRYLTSYRGVRPVLVQLADYPEDEIAFIYASIAMWSGASKISRRFVHERPDGTDNAIAYTTEDTDGLSNALAYLENPTPELRNGSILRAELQDISDQITDRLWLRLLTAGVQVNWLNRQGGGDQWVFTTTPAPGQKRTAATYQNAGGDTLTRRADLTQTYRLYSELLDRAAFDFLRTELAASPTVEVRFAPQAPAIDVTITDFDAKADVVTGEYYIELEVTPATPLTPLTR